MEQWEDLIDSSTKKVITAVAMISKAILIKWDRKSINELE